MLTGVHFLLTYTCTYECDHCFVHSSPRAEGTFTLVHLRDAIAQAQQIGTVRWIYFEGGEPFLFYPLLVEGVRLAREADFQVGIVTNGYFAISELDADIWLERLKQLGVADLSISDDLFHQEDADNPARRALRSARRLGIPSDAICIDRPTPQPTSGTASDRGAPVTGGGVMFRGRAAEKLTEGIARNPWDSFLECPHEELSSPERVHVDPYGNVHLCQGLTIGNMFQEPLHALLASYDPQSHPICGPLVRGGPSALASQYQVQREQDYVDACHLCYTTRAVLAERFPQYLTPRQCYGLS